LATNNYLRDSALAKDILPLLTNNDRERPRRLQRTMRLDTATALALGGSGPALLAEIAVEPLFDDFGDIFAAFIAHRTIKTSEPVLEEFAKLSGVGVI